MPHCPANRFFVFCLIALLGLLSPAANAGSALDNLLAEADAAVQAGGAPSQVTEALVRRAEARRLTGKLTLSLDDLARALTFAPSDPERAYVLVAYGAALAQAGRKSAAMAAMTEATNLSTQHPNPAIEAIAAATLAALSKPPGVNPLFETEQRAEASGWAQRALAHAGATRRGDLLAMAHLAAAEVGFTALGAEARRSASIHLRAALDALAPMPPTLATGQLALQASQLAAAEHQTPLAAAALAIAGRTPVPRLAAVVLEQQARLAAAAGNLGQAQALAAQALRTAQNTGDDELAFRTAWRAGQVEGAPDETDQSLRYYRLAFTSLKQARGEAAGMASTSQSLYHRSYGNFHHAFFDVLMARHDATGNPAFLREARDVVEDLKADEVEDYFQERCVPRNAAGVAAAQAGGRVAVLYPVVLADLMELLVEIGETLLRRTVPLPKPALESLVRGFRRDLENPRRDFRHRGKQLYDAMIAPIADALAQAGTRTIVYAPDAALRLAPLATLWDGERFLVERFAVATVLGLTFVPAESAVPGQSFALVAGAHAIPGYNPLAAGERELAGVVSHLQADRLFQTEFSQSKFADALQNQPYDIIHVASHAEVGPNPEDNFIAAIDGPIDMNQLALSLRARSLLSSRPLELLTLSACSTAGGDDLAPLGLAGIAFRAGARSVVASLWPVRDRATADMMEDLYTSLASGSARGVALAQAQAKMIRNGGAAADPSVWGAFLAIGDWR